MDSVQSNKNGHSVPLHTQHNLKQRKAFGAQTKNKWIILTGSGPPNNKMLNISHKPGFPKNTSISNFLLC